MGKEFYLRIFRLTWGLFLYSLGIALTINARIGYAPWDVFHVGFAKTLGTSIGTASIIIGIFIVVITLLMGEKVGLGTLANMILIGVFLDIILTLGILPVTRHLVLNMIMLITGLFFIALATYYYIGTSFGAGPRDSLMVGLTRKTGLPIGLCRAGIELLAVIIGWTLGGMVGIGTILAAFGIGFCVQITFKLLKFDATKVKHETLAQTYQSLFENKKQTPIKEKEMAAKDK